MPAQRQERLGTFKYKTLDFEWVVEETATLVKNARKRQIYRAESEVFDGWRLFADAGKDEDNVGIFLEAVNPKSETLVDFEFKISPAYNEHVCLAAARGQQAPFGPKERGGGRGYRSLLGEAALRRVGTRKLRISCRIIWGRGDKPAPTAATCADLFNKQEYSDIALFAGEGNHPIFVQSSILRKSRHFKTILDSDFSESSSKATLVSLCTAAPYNWFSGDIDEFASFRDLPEPKEDQQPQQDVAASETDDDAPDQPAKRPRLTPPLQSVTEEGQVPLREFRLVKVPDCSYATLATYVAVLYSSTMSLPPSAAVYLVDQRQTREWTDLHLSRWAEREALKGTYPSLPHAMYRLADCYMEPDIKARAQGSILQSMTLKTAAFELFSQLSLDYPEFQAEVVDFVVANLEDVIATPGWERAVELIDEGRIPGGASILHKILSGSSKQRPRPDSNAVDGAQAE